MSLWRSSDASGAPVTLTAPEVQAGQTLFSSSSAYSVLEFIGEGCFGKVARCQNLSTKGTVAVKILKDTDFTQDTEKEVSMLEVLSIVNPDHANVVKFFECFEYMGQTCLAFEMLDRSLYDMLQEQDWEPLSLQEVRPIAKQLLVALDVLKDIGILHTDIKPDNVMFVNKQDQPFRIKLIDFGEAIRASEVQPGMDLQPTGYRAPEVALGLPFTEAIDVWGVGCILAFLYLAENLFPVSCDYQMMKSMVEVLGQPEDHMLRAGKYTQYFFSEEEAADGPEWRLMTPEEYTAANDIEPQGQNSFTDLPCSLDDLVNIYPKGEAAEFKDRRTFVDLMKKLLHLDGSERISPCEALQHPFITMSHLTKPPASRAYLITSWTMMSVCPMEDSADRMNTSAVTRSSDGIKATGFYNDGPVTGSSDGVPVTYSLYKNPTSWSCDGGLPPLSSYGDPAAWSPDGGLRSLSYDKDQIVWSSDGELLHISYYPAPTAWPSDGGLPSFSYDEDPATWSFDGGPPYPFYYKDSAAWSSDGAQAKLFYAEAPACWII